MGQATLLPLEELVPSALTPDVIEQLEFLSSKGKSVKVMCERLGISKPTYYKWVRAREVA